MLTRLRRPKPLVSLLAVLATLATALVAFSASPAAAHGAMMTPGSRTYLCWQDGLTPQGNIVPVNPACQTAVATSGANSLYNWFSVLRSDGAGRTRGFIPDGQLCSGGNPNFTGYNNTNVNWPVTHLTAGANWQFKYSNWAAHPGTFHMYVTKSTYDPSKPLAWSDLEDTPFLSVTNPAMVGSPGSNDGHYYWNGNLPNKSGRHLIYSVWTRSDSQETFYGCSDVTFDGGNGEVTGVGQPGSGDPGDGDPGDGDPPTGTQTCTATQRTTGSWTGGYQGEVTIKNTGTAPLPSWMVHATLPSGARIDSLWNGTYTLSGTNLTVHNAAWNATVAPGATTTYGFVVQGADAPASAPALTCMTSM
ncbi:GlcNAc-binding protein A [Streptomyces sp. RB5]|uniref:GlcNAc-binding protein A n=1 Tax=Streptomyces smaragdinus TaxID=2585196 RepID=A0A7K0CJ64_9ACTN|nr:lytic polysaccharide monooxygenase [Streptomyces smaragdinus]MQY13525.1 GlcNAc-binding protein A [Streptomyces smaragdinus]